MPPQGSLGEINIEQSLILCVAHGRQSVNSSYEILYKGLPWVISIQSVLNSVAPSFPKCAMLYNEGVMLSSNCG